jgi:hypothetical protein
MSAEPTQQERRALAYLRSPAAIRERCQQVLDLACADRLAHFAYHADQLAEAAAYVVAVMRAAYPTLTIPVHSRWRHFGAGGVDRLAALAQRLGSLDAAERARCRFDLAITSVLLDAGAGEHWRYYEAATGQTYTRSEGLAVASFDMFLTGLFSSRTDIPWQADAKGLQDITDTRLGEAFQVTAAHPLVGLAGRAALLRQLGEAVASAPHYFGVATPRLGNLFDYLCANAPQGVLHARQILLAVLDSLSSIWPGRLRLGGVNLGDVWQHRQVRGNDLTAGLVPFHKLSQWLTYSLIEPLVEAGVRLEGVHELTGLAEYRNGGLFLDLEVLTPKHSGILDCVHTPDSEVVVEWRALTVALLDRLADQVRQALGLSPHDLPLASVLEGGTWRAGRQIARERRADGSPPLRLASDGTVF